ncbi:OsmC family protein [Mycoplasmoides pirum]|uniref:OsmC family protein n=1 Tax=Mycoplasmoides pirum TaxID=2122 RepID=UPI00048500E6|nr:OsmC family protein [Mycoplasmoides pirum]
MSIHNYKSETFLCEDGSTLNTENNFSFPIDHKIIRKNDVELKGMSPIAAWLNSLASCHLLIMKSYAEKQNIKLLNAKIVIESTHEDEPLDGYYGIRNITIHYYIQANNTTEEISNFIKYTQKRCPVHSTIEQLKKTKLNYIIHVIK